MIAARALAAGIALFAAAAIADGPHTGALTRPASGAPATHLGGDDPIFALYLRTDGSDGPRRREALAACLAGLARIPGAGIELYVDPTDRGSPALADALAVLDGERRRRTLLGALAARELPPPTDALGYARLAQALGLAPVRPRPSGSGGLRGAPMGLPRRPPAADASSRAFLRRPPFLGGAARSSCTLGGREVDGERLEALASSDAMMHVTATEGEAAALRVVPSAALGSALAGATVTVRVDLRDRRVLARQLAQVDEAVRAGRARVVLEAASGDDLPLVRRALSLCEPVARRRLLGVVLGQHVTDAAGEAWALQAAGIDPAGIESAVDAAVNGSVADESPSDTSSLRRLRMPSVLSRTTNRSAQPGAR